MSVCDAFIPTLRGRGRGTKTNRTKDTYILTGQEEEGEDYTSTYGHHTGIDEVAHRDGGEDEGGEVVDVDVQPLMRMMTISIPTLRGPGGAGHNKTRRNYTRIRKR